jgi:plastocyanin
MQKLLLCAASILVCGGFAARQQHDPIIIRQAGRHFSESELTVPRGTQLVFVNDDNVIHNVFSGTEGMTFNLRAQRPGKRSSVTLTHPGDGEIRCAFHPDMRLIVHVR